MEAYKKEKQQNICLRRDLEKLAKNVDKGREEKLKLKHVNETMKKQLDVLQSETGDVQKVRPQPGAFNFLSGAVGGGALCK